VGSVTRPLRELKGFEQISLEPGQSKQVVFAITSAELSFYRADMSFGAEAGEFDIFVGGSSDASLSGRIRLE
jgi:beta-glucosidase